MGTNKDIVNLLLSPVSPDFIRILNANYNRPRPECFRPADAFELVERLIGEKGGVLLNSPTVGNWPDPGLIRATRVSRLPSVKLQKNGSVTVGMRFIKG